MQQTIGKFLIVLTVLMSLAAAFAWIGEMIDPLAGAERAGDESIAGLAQSLADIRCQTIGTTYLECDRLQQRAAEKRADLGEGDGLGARHVLTMIAVVGVAVTGAWWWAARRGTRALS